MGIDMLTFDPSVNLGQIVEVVVITFAGIGAVARMVASNSDVKKNVESINGRLDKVDLELAKQTTILISLGEQGARLNNLEAQLALIQTRLMQPAASA